MKAHLVGMLLLLLAFASCSQDPTTVEGQVVEDHSRKPMPAATVQLYHKQNGGYQTIAGSS